MKCERGFFFPLLALKLRDGLIIRCCKVARDGCGGLVGPMTVVRWIGDILMTSRDTIEERGQRKEKRWKTVAFGALLSGMGWAGNLVTWYGRVAEQKLPPAN